MVITQIRWLLTEKEPRFAVTNRLVRNPLGEATTHPMQLHDVLCTCVWHACNVRDVRDVQEVHCNMYAILSLQIMDSVFRVYYPLLHETPTCMVSCYFDSTDI